MPERGMQIGYAMLERLIQRLFDLPEDQRPRLSARIKYLQRLHLPASANVGRTGRAAYDLDAILQTVLVFELLDAGISPAPAVRLVRQNWAETRMACGLAWQALRRRGRPGSVRVWRVELNALAEPGFGEGEDEMVALLPGGRVEAMRDVAAAMARPGRAPRHVLLVNLAPLLAALHAAWAQLAPMHADLLATELMAAAVSPSVVRVTAPRRKSNRS